MDQYWRVYHCFPKPQRFPQPQYIPENICGSGSGWSYCWHCQVGKNTPPNVASKTRSRSSPEWGLKTLSWTGWRKSNFGLVASPETNPEQTNYQNLSGPPPLPYYVNSGGASTTGTPTNAQLLTYFTSSFINMTTCKVLQGGFWHTSVPLQACQHSILCCNPPPTRHQCPHIHHSMHHFCLPCIQWF